MRRALFGPRVRGKEGVSRRGRTLEQDRSARNEPLRSVSTSLSRSPTSARTLSSSSSSARRPLPCSASPTRVRSPSSSPSSAATRALWSERLARRAESSERASVSWASWEARREDWPVLRAGVVVVVVVSGQRRSQREGKGQREGKRGSRRTLELLTHHPRPLPLTLPPPRALHLDPELPHPPLQTLRLRLCPLRPLPRPRSILIGRFCLV